MRHRILIPKAMLDRIATNIANGATLESQRRIFSLPLSRPVLERLLAAYNEGHHDSLFPEWLDDVPAKQPFHWRYEGSWPNGCWKEYPELMKSTSVVRNG